MPFDLAIESYLLMQGATVFGIAKYGSQTVFIDRTHGCSRNFQRNPAAFFFKGEFLPVKVQLKLVLCFVIGVGRTVTVQRFPSRDIISARHDVILIWALES